MSDQLYVTRSTMPTFEEYSDQIRKIWETCWLTNMGDNHAFYFCLNDPCHSEEWAEAGFL